MVDNGIVLPLAAMISSPKKSIRKEALWACEFLRRLASRVGRG
jgi:hypothetical protein